MRNVNISNFRKDLFGYVNQALNFDEKINVNTKNGNIVVMSEEEYNGLIETVFLMNIPGMKEKLVEGLNAKREDLVEIDWEDELS